MAYLCADGDAPLAQAAPGPGARARRAHLPGMVPRPVRRCGLGRAGQDPAADVDGLPSLVPPCRRGAGRERRFG